MLIIAGHITVDPEDREDYLRGCTDVVEQARKAVARLFRCGSVKCRGRRVRPPYRVRRSLPPSGEGCR